MPASDKTLHDLEWHRIVAAVAERCSGPLREQLAELPLAETEGEAQVSLRETAEALSLHHADEPLPLAGIRDVRRALDRIERQGAVEGAALRDLAHTLGAARVLRKFLARRRHVVPALFAACATDPTLDDLCEELERAVEPDGRLADSASPELARLRVEVANLRARIVARLEALVVKHADVLSDRFHTLRDGRYVLPVRTDAHERLQGIVHGTSGSGSTVFVEPRAVVEQGNRLRLAQGELEREEARILAILSARVGERAAETRAALDALDRADLRNASARLARDLKGVVAELDPRAVLRLVDARHPLLQLDGVDVVPNELSIAAGRGLILSGPNAGGKTVSLKILGLAAMMVRAGLPLPAAEGSSAGFFDPIVTDVGDEQSLSKNLSTFSAHVQNLVSILETAGPRALVLLDELATGTDPQEGAALACAVVDALCTEGAAVAVTTHYEALKALALEDARLDNASVGFDVERMAPTFRVHAGAPGASSALAVARRFGMPDRVIARAQHILPEQARTFDTLVRRLEERYQSLETERAETEQARRAAQRAREEAERELDALASRDRKRLSEEAEKLLSQLRDARAELKEARRAIREREDEAALARAKEGLEKIATTVASAVPAPPPPEPVLAPLASDAIGPGVKVWVPRLRAEVDVLEGPSKGRVRVAAGPLKLWVDVAELRAAHAVARKPEPAAAAPEPEREHLPPASSTNTLDVRGMRVDDALASIESFLDRMYGASEPAAYVLHGVGSGALRDAVRKHLERVAHYVKRARPATLEEGGDRLTVVYLR